MSEFEWIQIICIIVVNIIVVIIGAGTMKGLTKSSSCSGGRKSVEVKQIAASDLDKKSKQHLNIQVRTTPA